MQNFLVSNNEIIRFDNHLKDKTIRIPKNISSYFIKRTIFSLIILISLISNCSLSLPFIPNQWKISYVIPVHKKIANTTSSNYRPISLTRSFCRNFEHVKSIKVFDYPFLNYKFDFLRNRTSCF